MSKTIDFFYEISRIPRESGNESKIAEYLCDFAKERNLEYVKDEYNNVIIKKCNSEKEPLILQAHIDMVCEKDGDKEFDFDLDSIEVCEKDGYLCANGTTLGADNGIGVAQILNILDSDVLANIEAVFTASEETTMSGAENIDVGVLKGKKLICLDGFEEETILLESAAFFDIILKNKFRFDKSGNGNAYIIKLSGLEGGHSGFDINKGKGNAIQELAMFLENIKDIQLAHFNGGTKFNVIPSSAEAIFYTKCNVVELNDRLKEYLESKKREYKSIAMILEERDSLEQCLSNQDSYNYLHSLVSFKHGVYFENDSKEVTSSINLGVVDLVSQTFKIGMRSSRKKEEKEVLKYIKDYASNNNYEFVLLGSQPGFETSKDSFLIKKMREAYDKIDDVNKLKMKTVHITVEVGFFKEKIKNLDVAIISPNIIGAHTTLERVEISSVIKCDEWLYKIIELID